MRGVAAGAALLTSLLFAACESRSTFDGMAVDPPRAVPSFAFRLPDSSQVTLGPAAGKPLVLFFGYTHCPDVCPTTLADWKRVKATLGDQAASVRFVFVTVDPERDTPEVAQRYARGYDSTFVGVSGDALTTSRMMEAYGVAAAKEEGTVASGYLVSHSSQAFLVNDRGELVALYPFGTRWEALAADLQQLFDR